VRWIVGSGGVIPMGTVHKIIMLKRDPEDKKIVTELNVEQALQYMLTHNFCNPHQPVRDDRKIQLRTDFFRSLFQQTKVFLVNTTAPPHETQDEIRTVLKLKK
jgi:hypothetical protein